MKRLWVRTSALVLLLLVISAERRDASESLRPPKQGAALLKTEILDVFAHPDDETGVAATLAYYARGRNAVVANVYCTRGEGGGNMVGTQWGAALGVLREAELRECLATLGVRYCYFLDRLDWAYTESVSATLEKWNKEETLERLVRLVRALRPDVIVTMNPAPTPGQHGHHQAAGVLATEAFSAAADPNRFPLQLAREGLTVWQARRLFYGGGASNQVTASIVVNEPLSDGRTPAQIAGKALANHRSQAFGNFGDSPWLQPPQRFLLVKTFIANTGLEGDLLSGLPTAEVASQPIQFAAPAPLHSVTLRFVPRPAFQNYERWVARQQIEHVAGQFHADLPLVLEEANEVGLEVINRERSDLDSELNWQAPKGWRVEAALKKLKIPGGSSLTVPLQVTPVASDRVKAADGEIIASITGFGGEHMEANLVGHPIPRARVIRAEKSLPLDASGEAWQNVPAIEIAPTQLVQGKVRDAADSSASFRLAHDGHTFFIDVQVRDDVIVTNIAPNDIRGHWRSDSVEICLDPGAGAEHTMGCYKLGIFPWDSTGVVRGARDADANQGPIEETAPKTRIVSSRTADGYRIQAAIPFEEIGLNEGQKRLGFNLIIYDGDKADAALGENINKSRIAWSPRSGVQGRPEDSGRIDLE